MWLERADYGLARQWLTLAWRRLPPLAEAQGDLAAVEAATGDNGWATARLRHLAMVSDDPRYAADLARALGAAGQKEDAAAWRALVAGRYDELVARHPAAFAEGAAEFWVTVGTDPARALELARFNLEIRNTVRARALFCRAAAAARPAPADSP
jgi:hypothetical protein